MHSFHCPMDPMARLLSASRLQSTTCEEAGAAATTYARNWHGANRSKAITTRGQQSTAPAGSNPASSSEIVVLFVLLLHSFTLQQ